MGLAEYLFRLMDADKGAELADKLIALLVCDETRSRYGIRKQLHLGKPECAFL